MATTDEIIIQGSENLTPNLGTDDASTYNGILETLVKACAEGHTVATRDCLAKWKDMAHPIPPRPRSRPTSRLQPALLAAIENDQPSTVSYLLDEGFILDIEAVEAALKIRSFAILQVFLDHGWKIDQKLGATMAPALSRVIEDTDLMQWFLDHGANPNSAVLSWSSPMETAALKASMEVIELLVQHGGRVYPSNALPAAAKTSLPGRKHVLAYFLNHGAPIDAVEFAHDRSIFKKHWARAFGTALHHAAKRGNNELVEFLLQRGADREVKDSLGKTALQYAIEKDHRSTVVLFRDISIEGG